MKTTILLIRKVLFGLHAIMLLVLLFAGAKDGYSQKDGYPQKLPDKHIPWPLVVNRQGIC